MRVLGFQPVITASVPFYASKLQRSKLPCVLMFYFFKITQWLCGERVTEYFWWCYIGDAFPISS